VPEEERAEVRETAFKMAREVDEETGGMWGLEEWARGLSTDGVTD